MKKQKNRKANYAAISWRNLPTDKTMKAFRTEYKQATNREKIPSDAWLRGAVKALEDGNGEGTIFSDLFSPRDPDAAIQHSTIPRPIPYETQKLLSAIATVRDEDKHLKGDAFAERVFSVLANDVSPNSAADNYVDMLTLSQFRIQQELLRKFEGLLRQRLELLYNYIFMNAEGIHINELKNVLEQIDYLLTGFPDSTTDSKNTSAKQDLQTLYTNLLALRKEVVVEEATQNCAVEKLNWRDKNDQLIETLNNQLLQTSRSPKSKELSDFLYNYNEYLLRYLDPDVRENASTFSKTYKELHDYYFSDMNADQFKEIVYEELSSFSQAIFDELDRMELVNAASEYQPKSAATGYLRLRLTTVQENIINRLREPMRMLRAVFSFIFFKKTNTIFGLVNDNNLLGYDGNKISGASNYMMDIASELFEKCQYMLPPVEESLTLEEKIMATYGNIFSPVYERGISGKLLQQTTHVLATEPNSSIHYLSAVANLLRRMCKIYVSCECKKYEKTLLAEYEKMQRLLAK